MKKIACLILIVYIFCLGSAFGEGIAAWLGASDFALLQTDGSVTIPVGTVSDLFPLGNDLFAGGITQENNTLYGVLTADGEWLITPQYAALMGFPSGIAFRENGAFGVMDFSGNILTAAEYTALQSDGQGGYIALRDDVFDEESDTIYLISESGEETATDIATYSGLRAMQCGRMCVLNEQKLYGYMDAYGNWAISPQFLSADDFQNNLTIVSVAVENGMGILDLYGDWYIEPRYQTILRGENFFLCVGKDGMDMYGMARNILLHDDTAQSVEALPHYALLYDSSSIRVLNSEGKLLATFPADASVSEGSTGCFMVRMGQWGENCCALYDEYGTMLSEQYLHIVYLGQSELGEVYAFMENVDGEYLFGLMDSFGNILWNAQYAEIRLLSRNFLFAQSAEYRGIVNLSGESVYSISKNVAASPQV